MSFIHFSRALKRVISALMPAFIFTLLAGAAFAETGRPENTVFQPSAAISTTVVINEVYGGAGCGSAGCSTYQNDFIELKNISAGNVSIGGWSVQYSSATGTAWQVTPIPAGRLLRPGDTFLIAEASGANGVSPLPTPNLTGTIAMSATAGKVALVNNTVALSGACPAFGGVIVDFVGYGATANCSETGPAPAPSSTTSIARSTTVDADSNATDFSAVAPTPAAALQPTAAAANINGRVLSTSGRGISHVRVTVTDTQGRTVTALTSGFGYFSFAGLPAGGTYTITAWSKTHTFSEPTQITLSSDLNDLEIRADE